jgi:rhodanese-related sulfurtransferase
VSGAGAALAPGNAAQLVASGARFIVFQRARRGLTSRLLTGAWRRAPPGTGDAMTTAMPSPLFQRSSLTVAGYREVSPQAVFAARGEVRVIDVREPDEYLGELGHLAGAELVPLATVGERAATWDRDAELVMICRSGGRSARAAEQLVRAGFRNVMNLAGGMLAYHAAELPIEGR